MTGSRWQWIGALCACMAVALVFLSHFGEPDLAERAAPQATAEPAPGPAAVPAPRAAPTREEQADVWGGGAPETRIPGSARAEHADALRATSTQRDSASRGRSGPPPVFTPAFEAQLEEELLATESVIEASRDHAEEAIARAQARAPALPPPLTAAAKAAAVRLACGGEGSSCLSSANCCAGLACAGGLPGFAARGRCEASRFLQRSP